MSKILCILLVVLLCGCTTHPQRSTFEEKYNVFKNIELDGDSIDASDQFDVYWAKQFLAANISVYHLENFADAIIRRMDARTLQEYHQIQEEVDWWFGHVRTSISPRVPAGKSATAEQLLTEKIALGALLHYYSIRQENYIPGMIKTVQVTRYLHSDRF